MPGTVSVKVLGSGCANCRKLEALAREVVGELKAHASVEHVHDFQKIAAYGVLATRASSSTRSRSPPGASPRRPR